MFRFPNAAAEFVFCRTYSRWLEDQKRRETYPETVERFITFIVSERGDKIPEKVIRKIRQHMLALEVVPSMRALWAAGEAARVENVCTYNCAFTAIDSIESFSEVLYVLMCGAGVGFSVERHNIDKLPSVPQLSSAGAGIFVIDDSRAGWADSVKYLMMSLYHGKDMDMDYSKIRPKGARLNTMGGRASGPAPLIVLHNFIRETFQKAQGRNLTSLEIHDICNQIAEVVVVGGVRRSAQISLSDLDDQEMRSAKVGSYPLRRAMSNNSSVYKIKPTAVEFLAEWSALAASGTGERGIFNLEGARNRAPKRRKAELISGANPCLEILLRSAELCNLSEVVVRAGDDLDDLMDKVTTATWLGAIQSTFTTFPYLRPKWAANCEEERLLGVSLTGQFDNPELLTPDALKALKAKAIKVARHAAQKLGINMPVAVTCCKPSGTTSQVCNSSSGLHPRFAPYYLRRYRISSTDPLLRLLVAQGVPVTPENGQGRKDWVAARKGDLNACTIYQDGKDWSEDMVNTWVVAFPVRAPEGCVTRDQLTAIQQLEHYRTLQENWCEHSASCTVYVKDKEWFEVGNWVYRNWDRINGVSFLPFDGGEYQQAPYEVLTKEQYDRLVEKFPKIDYSELSKYELEDQTEGARMVACAGNVCEL